MNLLGCIAVVGVLVSLGYYLIVIELALRFARPLDAPLHPLAKVPPRVAMLKPLLGINESLAHKLMRCLELAYPRADYYFGVSDSEDRAAGILVTLGPRYQFANITAVVGEAPNCANHKIGKIIKMADRAEKCEPKDWQRN